MESLVTRILIRWLANSAGLWLAGNLLSSITFNNSVGVILWAGLALSVVNAFLKPIVVILSLPAIIFSLGIFMVFVNGLMVLLAAWLVGDFEVDGYGSAVLAGFVIGLVNYAITAILEDRRAKKNE